MIGYLLCFILGVTMMAVGYHLLEWRVDKEW